MENLQNIEEQATYAGFGKRMAAMLIDRLLLSVATYFMHSEVFREMQRLVTRNEKFWTRVLGKGTTDDSTVIYSLKYEIALELTYWVLSIIFIFILWAYNAGMESSPWRGTIGKRLMGLEVSDEGGNRISFLKATGRYFGKIISIVVLCIGYIAMLFNDKKQTWHDSMSGCIVTEK